MKILTIAYYDVKRFLRDKKTLGYMIFLPIILIAILGTALSSVFEINNMDKINVAYVNEDEGEYSKGFDEFLEYKEIKEIVSYRKVATLGEGEKLLRDKEVKGIIYIGEDYSRRIKAGDKTFIEVVGKDSSSFSYIVLKNIIESYVQQVNAYKAMSSINMERIKFDRTEVLKDNPITSKGKKPSAMDYYAVTMLVMIILYGANYGAGAMAEGRMSPIGRRIQASPLRSLDVVFGKTIGAIFSMSWQILTLVLFSKFVFKANFGSNIMQVLFICFIATLFSISLGILICSIFKEEALVSKIISILVPIFTLVSGGYVKINMPDSGSILSKITKLSPSYLAQKAIFGSIYEGSALEIRNSILILLGFSLIFFLISIIFERRARA
ncbi:ABC transporter permease [Clostridium sp. MSJ-4]|uniref:ABC transporter permease n=1 Tax=Clostridium simiarum TaxID=2841506 RepID=A0ABS6F208_9CLOT|nr:ABC transporter permease [Clostridium simiarum]MBU5592557.1 ABC transporter permease [Clostridium simiarum]